MKKTKIKSLQTCTAHAESSSCLVCGKIATSEVTNVRHECMFSLLMFHLHHGAVRDESDDRKKAAARRSIPKLNTPSIIHPQPIPYNVTLRLLIHAHYLRGRPSVTNLGHNSPIDKSAIHSFRASLMLPFHQILAHHGSIAMPSSKAGLWC